MLQPHSLVWHYLWVAPSVLLLVLAGLMWRLRLNKQYPLFFVLAIANAVEQLTLYACDLAPSVSAKTWWQIFWAGLLVEGLLKFGLVAEIFANVFNPYPSVAKLGKVLIRTVGVSLLFAAACAAAWAPEDSVFSIVTGAHLLQQTVCLVEAGLLVVIFLLSSYFHLSLDRPLFGIALGLSVSACVDLAAWAIAANAGLPPEKRVILDFAKMATYHISVLIWFYYLLLPQKVPAKSMVPLPENNLDVWNRELERLVHP
jgi:hypothetical protein